MFKKKLPFLPAFFLVTAISFFLFSCRSSEKERMEGVSLSNHAVMLVDKARHYQESHPDSAIMYADSAMALIHKARHYDAEIIPPLQIKAIAWMNKGYSDSAINILIRARTIAIGANDTLALAYTSFKLGEILVDRADYTSAETYIRESVTSYELLKMEYKTASVYNLYGSLLIARRENMKAQKYLMKAADIFKRLDSLGALGAVYVTIADNNNETGNKPEATKYYNLAISQLVRAHDTSNLRTAYMNMGIMYRNTDPDSALACYLKAIALLAAEDPSQPPIMEKYNIANLYLDQKQYGKALEEYDRVLEYCRPIGLAGGIARVFSGYASVYQETGKTALSQYYLNKAVRMADSIGDRSLALKLRLELMENYRKQGDYRAAMLVADTIKITRDTMMAIDNRIALQNMEQLHQAEKKERENTYLKIQIESREKLLFFRNLIIAILLIATFLLGFVLWKSNRLYLERSEAYRVLMIRYKEDIVKREHPVVVTGLELSSEPEKDTPTAVPADPLIALIIDWFTSEKPYLNPKLKVDDVADKLGTTQKAVSLALKRYNDSNFTTFINHFRVEEAKRRLENPEYQNYKITAIAHDSGFGSKQSFYTAFVQATGIQPSYYRSNLYPDTQTTGS